MSGYTLAIDFGTTYTAAGTNRDGRTTLIDLEGDGSTRMSSAVWVAPDRSVVVGRAALSQAVLYPSRSELTPKRLLGQQDVVLDGAPIPVVELVAGILRSVLVAARRENGDVSPSRVHLTHPAAWGEARLQALRAAAEVAGMPVVRLIAEPVAAALHIGAGRIEPGQHVVVYDFGGGTFDVAVLRRTSNDFEVVGQPLGLDPLGGLDIDHRLLEHLAAGPLGHTPEWAALGATDDATSRRRRQQLLNEVRNAKEMLSRQTSWQLWLPGLEREATLTRTELEDVIRQDVEATIDTTEATIKGAGLALTDIESVFLAGGSSRVPLVADRAWRRLGLRPETQDDPKSVVVLGAASLGPAGLRVHEAPVATPFAGEGPGGPIYRGPSAPQVAAASGSTPGRGRMVVGVALAVALLGGGSALAFGLHPPTEQVQQMLSVSPSPSATVERPPTATPAPAPAPAPSPAPTSPPPASMTVTVVDRLYAGQAAELIDLQVNGASISLHPTADQPSQSVEVTIGSDGALDWTGTGTQLTSAGTKLAFSGAGRITRLFDGAILEVGEDPTTGELELEAE